MTMTMMNITKALNRRLHKEAKHAYTAFLKEQDEFKTNS